MNSTDKQPCEKCEVVHDLHIELYCKKISELRSELKKQRDEAFEWHQEYLDANESLNKVRKEALCLIGERDLAQSQVQFEARRADGHYENYCQMLKGVDAVSNERDEARAEVERLSVQVADWELLSDRLKEAMDIAHQKTKVRNDKFDELCKQRDEALAKLEKVKGEFIKMSTNYYIVLQGCSEGGRKLNEWAEKCKKLSVELDASRVEVAQLKDTVAAYEQATVNQQLTVRPEPSRLEIAAMLKTGWFANPEPGKCAISAAWWLSEADALIEAAKEVAK
jgi:chromosome segregation ATPase